MNLPWTEYLDSTIPFTVSGGYKLLFESRMYFSVGNVFLQIIRKGDDGSYIVIRDREYFSPLPSVANRFFKTHILIFTNSLHIGRVENVSFADNVCIASEALENSYLLNC